MVARHVTVVQDQRMRLAAAALLVAVPASFVMVAGAAGRAVRVEAPRRVEVLVPAGGFTMGVSEDLATATEQQCKLAFYPPDQVPSVTTISGMTIDFCSEYAEELRHMAPRRVTLDAYMIDRDEVSVTDYRACIDAGGCTLDALVAGDERYIRGDWPIVNVTWDEAVTYCAWRGARLPTEAEWERAARGDGKEDPLLDQENDWPWGEIERPADFNHGQARAVAMRQIERQPATLPLRFFGDPDDSDGHPFLAKPGSYPWGESPYGTRDQAGNVAEWTADAHFRDPTKLGLEGLPTHNPVRDGTNATPRVVRGGSWRQPTFLARGNLRDPFNLVYDPTKRYSHVGFRCARTVR